MTCPYKVANKVLLRGSDTLWLTISYSPFPSFLLLVFLLPFMSMNTGHCLSSHWIGF